MIRTLFTLGGLLFGLVAHAAPGETECNDLRSYKVRYAWCLAHHENYAKCTLLDDPLEAQCLAYAKKSTSPCSSLDGDAKQVCTAYAYKSYTRCSVDDEPAEAFCEAILKLRDSECSGAGPLKTDCDKLVEHLVALGKAPTRTERPEGNRGSEVATLQTELGQSNADKLLAVIPKEVVRQLVDELGATAVKKYIGAMKPAGIKQILDAGVTPDKLKVVISKVGDTKFDQLQLDSIALLASKFTGDQVGTFLANAPVDLVNDFLDLGSAGTILKNSFSHFGTPENTGKVFDFAKTHGMPVADLKSFLVNCKKYGWKNTTHIETFFLRGKTVTAGWAKVIEWAILLNDNTQGSTTKVAGRKSLDPSATYKLTLKDAGNNDVVITFNSSDAAHVASRHTWDRFAVSMGNCKPRNTMFPTSITESSIPAMGDKILKSSAISTLVSSMNPGDTKTTSLSVSGVTVTAMVDMDGPNGLVSFYPSSGTGVEDVPKDGMRASIALYNSK